MDSVATKWFHDNVVQFFFFFQSENDEFCSGEQKKLKLKNKKKEKESFKKGTKANINVKR